MRKTIYRRRSIDTVAPGRFETGSGVTGTKCTCGVAKRRQAWSDYKLLQRASDLTAIGTVTEQYGGFIDQMEERRAAIEIVLQNIAAE